MVNMQHTSVLEILFNKYIPKVSRSLNSIKKNHKIINPKIHQDNSHIKVIA